VKSRMNMPIACKTHIRRHIKLAPYCTMQVGGEAAYFAEPANEEELRELVLFARQENMPSMILGKGSNVIFEDRGYPGLIILMTHFDERNTVIDAAQCQITATSGIHLYKLALICRNAGLGGVEFLASIPGTLGGALVMNAGYSRHPGQKNEIGDLVQSVHCISPQGKSETWGRDRLQFSYRHSNLQEQIVVAATLQLWKRQPEDIEKEIRSNFDYRNQKQDLKHPSSGSIFKNPAGGNFTAGQLIDKLGLRGLRVGGAMVSEKHGNYIINAGDATCEDIKTLINRIQTTVWDAKAILLEPEVRIIESH